MSGYTEYVYDLVRQENGVNITYEAVVHSKSPLPLITQVAGDPNWWNPVLVRERFIEDEA